ncbi:ATP synthase-coupling factor 6, mitochondrial-like [Tupaia chinensis]|uniref:ATP synthase-coupling factor 6, mitochondrial-like n=1 Tax=Tupaia chinensis TaxID=246437 RepID=UPI000FFBB053|nr:ATP synthase-coupling factor 6, mitochondrial-like [Tupaia chinensis]
MEVTPMKVTSMKANLLPGPNVASDCRSLNSDRCDLDGGSGSSGLSANNRVTRILQTLQVPSIIRSAVSAHSRRNVGVTAVAFNTELDPVRKLFMDKIRECKPKRQTAGAPVDTGPEYQQDLERELCKLQRMYSKADMNTLPNFKFEDPKCEIDKPPSGRSKVTLIQ